MHGEHDANGGRRGSFGENEPRTFVARWTATLAEIRQHAIDKNSRGVYPRHNGSCRSLENTALHVAVADEAPGKWDWPSTRVINLGRSSRAGGHARR